MFTHRKKLLCLEYHYLKKKANGKKTSCKKTWGSPFGGSKAFIRSDLQENEGKFQNYFWMSIKSFEELLSKLNLECLHCVRVPISPTERLCVTLR